MFRKSDADMDKIFLKSKEILSHEFILLLWTEKMLPFRFLPTTGTGIKCAVTSVITSDYI